MNQIKSPQFLKKLSQIRQVRRTDDAFSIQIQESFIDTSRKMHMKHISCPLFEFLFFTR